MAKAKAKKNIKKVVKKISKQTTKKSVKKPVKKLSSRELKKVIEEVKATQPFSQEEDVLLTKEGLEALREELNYLKDVKRKELADRIKEAIGYGDLSENAEYDDAKNEQAFIEGRIVELEQKIKNAKIIKEAKGKGKAGIEVGSKIVIYNLRGKENETYTIVGSTESDPLTGKISNESPVGSMLLGKKVGESITVTVPEGMVEYKVKKIF